MSSLIVEVCLVDDVVPHPSADKLAVAHVKGWNVVVNFDENGKPWCKKGDKVVYFPPDSILQKEVSDKHGVTNYLGELPKNEDGTRPPGGRVRVANLRSFKSYGFCAPLDDPSWEVGKDVADYYGVTKYEPPVRMIHGDAESPHPGFHRYYDMENIRNFMGVFTDGEEVVATEKIHGENCRLGLVRDTDDSGKAIWKWMAGSHDVRRKKFWTKCDRETGAPVGEPQFSSMWACFNEQIRAMLCELSGCGYSPAQIDNDPPVLGNGTERNVVLFGERFGSSIQDMAYGFEGGKFDFRAFDVTLDGRYLDYDSKKAVFSKHGVQMVPEVYRGPFDFSKLEELSEGPTLVTDKVVGKKNFREGIVILSTKEQSVITEKKVMDRKQMKLISFTYLNRKDGTEFK